MRRAIATLCCVIVGLELFALGTLLAAGALLLFAGVPVGVRVPHVTSAYSSPHYVSDAPYDAPPVPTDSPWPSPPTYPSETSVPRAANATPAAPTPGEVATWYESDISLPPAESESTRPGTPRPFLTPAPTLSTPQPSSSRAALALVRPPEVASPPTANEGSTTESSPGDEVVFETLLASRNEVGSPLDGTLLADPAGEAAEEATLVERFKQLTSEASDATNPSQFNTAAVEDTAEEPQPRSSVPAPGVAAPPIPVAPIPSADVAAGPWGASPVIAATGPAGASAFCPADAPVAAHVGDAQSDDALDATLNAIRRATLHLYAVAERHEHESGNWKRADELRRLARRLHGEMVKIANEPAAINLRVKLSGLGLCPSECEEGSPAPSISSE